MLFFIRFLKEGLNIISALFMLVYTTWSCKRMTNVTSIAIPSSLLKRARKLGINVSGTSRDAVAAAVEKVEKAQGIGRQTSTLNITPVEADNNDIST
jgi:5,10-methylenetetrahydrofolate reductase